MHSEGSGKVIRISVNVSKEKGAFFKKSGKNVRVKERAFEVWRKGGGRELASAREARVERG